MFLKVFLSFSICFNFYNLYIIFIKKSKSRLKIKDIFIGFPFSLILLLVAFLGLLYDKYIKYLLFDIYCSILNLFLRNKMKIYSKKSIEKFVKKMIKNKPLLYSSYIIIPDIGYSRYCQNIYFSKNIMTWYDLVLISKNNSFTKQWLLIKLENIWNNNRFDLIEISKKMGIVINKDNHEELLKDYEYEQQDINFIINRHAIFFQ